MIKKIFIGIIVVILLVAVIASQYIGSVVEAAVEKYAPEVLGVEVNVDDVDISFFSGKTSFKGLVVHNPQGFKSDYVLNLTDFYATMDLGSVFSDVIVIHEMHIIKPDIIYEVLGNDNNVKALNRSIKSGGRKEKQASAPEEKKAEKKSEPKKVIIENLYIKAATITPAISGLSTTVALPDIHLKDVGKKSKGVTFSEAVKQVFAAVMGKFNAVDVSKLVGDLGGMTKELEKEAEGVLGEVEGATDKVKGLFGQ